MADLKHPFAPLPYLLRHDAPMPVVAMEFSGIPAPIPGLVDSGSRFTIAGAQVAEFLGLDPNDGSPETIASGGVTRHGTIHRVDLRVGEESYEAAVLFVDPWPHDDVVLGIEGFFRHFDVHIDANGQYIDITPHCGDNHS